MIEQYFGTCGSNINVGLGHNKTIEEIIYQNLTDDQFFINTFNNEIKHNPNLHPNNIVKEWQLILKNSKHWKIKEN